MMKNNNVRRKMENGRCVLMLLLVWIFASAGPTKAQDRYWAVGTAVPGGIQELTAFPGNKFKYTGRLIEGGTLRFRNMEVPKGISVRYLKPTYENAYAVTGAIPFTMVRDSSGCEWVVPLTEDIYRITIDIKTYSMTTETYPISEALSATRVDLYNTAAFDVWGDGGSWLYNFSFGYLNSGPSGVISFAQDATNPNLFYLEEPLQFDADNNLSSSDDGYTTNFIIHNFHPGGWWDVVCWKPKAHHRRLAGLARLPGRSLAGRQVVQGARSIQQVRSVSSLVRRSPRAC